MLHSLEDLSSQLILTIIIDPDNDIQKISLYFAKKNQKAFHSQVPLLLLDFISNLLIQPVDLIFKNIYEVICFCQTAAYLIVPSVYLKVCGPVDYRLCTSYL